MQRKFLNLFGCLIIVIGLLLQGCNAYDNNNSLDTINNSGDKNKDMDTNSDKKNTPISTDKPLEFLTESNIEVIHLAHTRYGRYDEQSSIELQWSELSRVLEHVFQHTQIDSKKEILHEERQVELKKTIFNDDFPVNETLKNMNHNMKYIRVKYNKDVTIPLDKGEIVVNDIAINVSNIEKESILEVYVMENMNIYRFDVMNSVDIFNKWYDEYTRKHVHMH